MSKLDQFKSRIESANLLISFCLNPAYDKYKNPVFWLKIQGGDFWELNIQVTKDELKLFSNVESARWSERSSIKIGKCLGSPTFWSCDADVLSILIGNDDESWEIGIVMNKNVLEDLLKEIENANEKYVLVDNKWLL